MHLGCRYKPVMSTSQELAVAWPSLALHNGLVSAQAPRAQEFNESSTTPLSRSANAFGNGSSSKSYDSSRVRSSVSTLVSHDILEALGTGFAHRQSGALRFSCNLRTYGWRQRFFVGNFSSTRDDSSKTEFRSTWTPESP